MKSIYTITFKVILVLLLITSCEKNDPIDNQEEKVSIVTKFIFDGMSSLYLWNTDVINKEPTVADSDPKAYFKSILYQTDKDKGWSWITDDAEELRAEFAGEPKSFGYSLSFIKSGDNIFAFVKYVYPDTPASDAGLERLDFIGKVNGKPITADKDGYISSDIIEALYGDNKISITIYHMTTEGFVEDRTEDITPVKTKTNPVLYENIFEVDGKKIGYILYNSYISNFNNKLYEAFSKFKDNGVDNLILDLRYNRGGDISAATYLASMIAPEEAVRNKEILTKLVYNNELGDNIYKLGEYSKDFPNPLTANLDLDEVFIIATDESYSASELTTFCLREFTKVYHLGSKTGGKYTASITVHPFYEDLGYYPLYPSQFFPQKNLAPITKEKIKNWAMQPIVAKYTNNKDEDFIATDGLIPDVHLLEGFGSLLNWTPFGDFKDVFLGEAIYMITGNEEYKPEVTRSTISAKEVPWKETNKAKEIRKESVNIDVFNY